MAEGGGNQREEIIDEPEGQWIQIPVLRSDEIKRINDIIKEQVNQLKLYLERKSYTPTADLAERFASQLLLNNASITEIPNGPGDPIDQKDIQDKRDALKAKLPRFLIIIALVKREGTIERTNEKKTREMSVDDYMKNYDNYNTEISHEREFVEDFSEMKDRVRDFIGKTTQTELSIVVFMGHGSESGNVLFAKEHVPIRKVLNDLEECHVNSRQEGMPLGELRIVFSQCYGHKVDDDVDDEKPKVKHTSLGTQYMYLSNSEKDPKSQRDRCITTTFALHAEKTFSSLKKLDHPETDVCLDFEENYIFFQEELFKSEVFENTILSKLCQQLLCTLSDEDAASMPEYVKVTAKDLQDLQASKDLKETKPFRNYVLKRYFIPWVKKGPSEDLPPEMKEEVNKYRREMKRFIVVQYGPMESTHDMFNHILDKWVQKPFDCLKEKVDSKEAMFKTIDDFINQSKVMHVVLVYGTGHLEPNSEALLKEKARTRKKEEEENEQTERLVLHLSDTEKVPAEDILQRCIKKKERLRMVFCCSIEGDLVWFSNDFPAAVTLAWHVELMEYAMIIVGPGPQTVVIQPNTQEGRVGGYVKTEQLGTV